MTDTPQDHPEYGIVATQFDATFYRAGFAPGAAPADPVLHYLSTGWLEGRDPAPGFSTRHYLADHADVRAAGVNPFWHFLQHGRTTDHTTAPPDPKAQQLYQAHAFATAPGPHFEPLDRDIGAGGIPRAKILAYYLPQFHPIAENDASWGTGFTEWRNLPRGMPRFQGHIQPRIPRDLGQYSLANGDTYRQQIDMARAAGIHGFCFYYYWFDGRRVLDTPTERMLDDPDLDFPFCLMWTNENWTRTWDGHENDVILAQNYREEDDEAFVDDLARHFKDPRYIRVQGRPLYFIYRPGQIPESRQTIARWRHLLKTRHDLDPLIFMAQGFDDEDPRPHGLDGAIEFPPHKICQNLPNIRSQLDMIDPDFSGIVMSYDATITRSLDVPVPDFPFIRAVAPHWDNEARRPGRGLALQGSTPEKFRSWLDMMIAHSQAHPVDGESFVVINAWNEWAESAVLEPDVHFGGAYLNSVARAVFGKPDTEAKTDPGTRMVKKRQIALAGHDAQRSGAQILALNIGTVLARGFGVQLAYLLGADGPMLEQYQKIAPVDILPRDPENRRLWLSHLRAKGFAGLITNTTVMGDLVACAKATGYTTVALIHELRQVITARDLQSAAREIAEQADVAIFPAEVVRDSFVSISGPIRNTQLIRPQGLYGARLLSQPRADDAARARLGLPPGARLVINVGYGDLRKGVDRFFTTARALCAQHPDLYFVWVGTAAAEATPWRPNGADQDPLSDRIRLLDDWVDPAPWFAAADLFFLTAREDPFPSVVMEALAMGLPIVGYEGTGGCDALIRRHGQLVSAADPQAAEQAILALLTPPADTTASQIADSNKARRQAEIAANYRFDDYCFDLLRHFEPTLPKVSVVVPNYNYEGYLDRRLRSIFDQTLPVFETIVLDDASSDGSLAEIARIASDHQRTIDLVVNPHNSGSPFPQWRKGVMQARGDYIWIAEADDDAKPEFLDRLATKMEQTDACLGFCDSWQMDEHDTHLGDSYRAYVNDIEPGRFDTAFVMAGQEFLSRFLSVKNVILNVSGVLFRHEVLAAAIDSVGPELDFYGVAGDWRLYIEICAMGGKVVYDPTPMNGHRRHAISVTHALKASRHLEEIQALQRLAFSVADVSPPAQTAQKQHLEAARRYLGVDD